MHQRSILPTAACESLQIGSPRFLNRGLHLDFEVLQLSKLVEIWGTQNETKKNPQLNVRTSLVDSYSASKTTNLRDIEGRS